MLAKAGCYCNIVVNAAGVVWVNNLEFLGYVSAVCLVWGELYCGIETKISRINVMIRSCAN